MCAAAVIRQRLRQYAGCTSLLIASTCLTERPAIIFSIGTEDQSPAEFLLASGPGWQRYEKTVHAPVRFIAGKSTPQETLPYIHPSVRDTWAGSKTHPFTIQFGLSKIPAKLLARTGPVSHLHEPHSISFRTSSSCSLRCANHA